MFQRKAKAPYAAATTLQQFRRVTSRYKGEGYVLLQHWVPSCTPW